jgi:hypothetical protein
VNCLTLILFPVRVQKCNCVISEADTFVWFWSKWLADIRTSRLWWWARWRVENTTRQLKAGRVQLPATVLCYQILTPECKSSTISVLVSKNSPGVITVWCGHYQLTRIQTQEKFLFTNPAIIMTIHVPNSSPASAPCKLGLRRMYLFIINWLYSVTDRDVKH